MVVLLAGVAPAPACRGLVESDDRQVCRVGVESGAEPGAHFGRTVASSRGLSRLRNLVEYIADVAGWMVFHGVSAPLVGCSRSPIVGDTPAIFAQGEPRLLSRRQCGAFSISRAGQVHPARATQYRATFRTILGRLDAG